MTLVRFEPFRELENFSRRMNSMMKGLDTGVMFDHRNFVPRVDVSEDDKNIYIHAELPGMAKEDVQVTVNDNNILTIKGEKRKEEKQEDKIRNYMRIERSYGSFTRSFSLPDDVNTEGISGSFENGVLNITLPKAEARKPKEITIDIKDRKVPAAGQNREISVNGNAQTGNQDQAS